jgi:hypothetical protein
MGPLSRLCIWAEQHIETVNAARAEHDVRSRGARNTNEM